MVPKVTSMPFPPKRKSANVYRLPFMFVLWSKTTRNELGQEEELHSTSNSPKSYTLSDQKWGALGKGTSICPTVNKCIRKYRLRGRSSPTQNLCFHLSTEFQLSTASQKINPTCQSSLLSNFIRTLFSLCGNNGLSEQHINATCNL